MPKLTVTNRSGEVFVVDAENGISIMESIRDLDESVEAICGGLCACATCHVYIAAEAQAQHMHPRTTEEMFMLEDRPHFDAERSRLSCQIIASDALDGLELEIAPEDI